MKCGEPMSSETSLPPRRDPGLSQKRKKRGLLKTTLFVLLFGLLIGIVFLVYLLFKFDGMLGKSSLPSPDVSIGEPPLKPNEAITSEPTAILILGLDTRKETGSLNTDVIMVASFRPDGKYATLVSIPRDTYMKPEGYRARKANAFYSVAMRGDKDEANDVVKKIYGDYLDIKIDYIIKIDFKTFEDIVDQLGGVEVDVDMDMRYEDPTDGTNINLKKGNQILDGKQALDYVRYRKSSDGSTAESSDYERNQRQQKVIAAIVDKAKSIRGLLNLGGIFDAVGDNIKSDFIKEDLRDFIWTYKGIGNEHIQYIPLKGEWKSPYNYVSDEELDQAKIMLKQD